MTTRAAQEDMTWISDLSDALGAGLGEAAVRLPFEDQQLESLRTIGQQRLEQGRPGDALACFAMLVKLRPNQPAHLGAMASVLYDTGRFEEALVAFRFVDLLDPFKPEHTLSVAQCLLRLHRSDEAAHLLGVVIEHCRDKPSQSVVLERARALLDLMRISDGYRH